MTHWHCGIEGCEAVFDGAAPLIEHQSREHEPTECKVCGAELPAGFLAIRHVFEEHTRAEYVRAYDAGSDDIRRREEVKDRVEEDVDLQPLIEDLDTEVRPASAGG